MGGIIKAQAGSLVRSLAVAALPVSELQTRRIPALGAVSLAASGDGLFVTATSLHATIRTWIDVAEADGEVALPPEQFADLVRHFPAEAEITITSDERAATVTSGKCRFKLPVLAVVDLPHRHVLGEESAASSSIAGPRAICLPGRRSLPRTNHPVRTSAAFFCTITATILSPLPRMDFGSAVSPHRSRRRSQPIVR